MLRSTLSMLACPHCLGPLVYQGADSEVIRGGALFCELCSASYTIVKGIPQFAPRASLTGENRRLTRMYDLFADIYPLFMKLAMRFIRADEERSRREYTDHLAPYSGRLLEISVGGGNNLPYLMQLPGLGEVTALDISTGQMTRCQRLVQRRGWQVELLQANAEKLPFKDGLFTGVLHTGGINFFNNRQAAINEMVRVAQSGALIVIGDELEKGARAYERTIPFFKRPRQAVTPPIDLLPPGMQDVRLDEVWNGWAYRLEFRKPLSAGVDQHLAPSSEPTA